MKLYIVRHGRTNYNVLKLLNSSPNENVVLTDLGKEQAEKRHKELHHIRFDKIYVSQLRRTKDTAEIIVPNQPKIVDVRINERLTGCEDQSTIIFHEKIKLDKFNTKLDGGESFQELKKRVRSFLNDLNGVNILVVTHYEIMAAMIGHYNNLTDEEMLNLKIPNCMLVEIEIND